MTSATGPTVSAFIPGSHLGIRSSVTRSPSHILASVFISDAIHPPNALCGAGWGLAPELPHIDTSQRSVRRGGHVRAVVRAGARTAERGGAGAGRDPGSQRRQLRDVR